METANAGLEDKIDILYEDNDALVVNKPSGLIVHSDGRTQEPSLSDWLVKKYPQIVDVGELVRAGIIHRLDRETSGVLIVAKNQNTFEFLKKQFQDRKVEKIYHAFVYGHVKNDEGVINRPIARSKRNAPLWSATRGRRGKEREAITEYKVLNRGEHWSFVELRPLTGRTHQLRVHLKAINYPVVCDKLYAPKRESLLGFSRLALHARSLSIALPSGKTLKIEAPYPEDFQRAVEKI